jgi:hypothetical protein
MQARVLRGEDIARVQEAGGPLAEHPEVLEHLKAGTVAAIEDETGRIVAYWPLWVGIHAEPLWVTEAARTPKVIRLLIQTLQQAMAEEGIPTVFAVIGHGDLATSLPPALKLGFERVPGDLFFVRAEGFGHGGSGSSGDLSGLELLRQPEREEGPTAGGSDDDGPPGFSG